ARSGSFSCVPRRPNPETLPQGLEFKKEVAPVGVDESGDIKTKPVTFALLTKKDGETTQQALARMREWVATLEPPPDREIGLGLERESDPVTSQEREVGWRTYLLRSRAEITSDMIRVATAMP